MIALAGCSTRQRIVVAGSKSMELMLELHRRGYLLAAAGADVIKELVLRFVLGGVIVSLFSLLGDLWKPKTFSGIFGAAPSVALA